MSGDKIVIVTGASRGIGRALSVEFSRRGHIVYGGARTEPEDAGNLSFNAVKLDVTGDESVQDVVKKIVARHGRVDILVNNAGISHCGSLEETPIEYGRKVFETNYFGILRMVNAVVPYMRKQGRGVVANVGSASGKIGIPFQGHYSASKFAVEGLSESMWYELDKFGIRVLLIEPGDVETDIWERTKTPIPPGSPYTDVMTRFLNVKAKEMSGKAASPESVAAQIADIVLSETKQLRHPVAKMAGVFLGLRKILPDRIFLWAVGKNYGIK